MFYPKIESLERRCLYSFGDVDTSWATSGRVVSHFGTDGGAIDVSVEGQKIYALGFRGLIRYSAAGIIDSSFAKSGELALSAFEAHGILIDDLGRILLFGRGVSGQSLRRYKADGSPDSGFGKSGQLALPENTNFSIQRLAVQADGKLLVAGLEFTGASTGSAVRIYRLNSSGSADSFFGKHGIAQVQLGVATESTPQLYDSVGTIGVLSSGKIVLAGTGVSYLAGSDNLNFLDAQYGTGVFAVARLTSAGVLDSAYGQEGRSRTTLETGPQLTRYSVDELGGLKVTCAGVLDGKGNVTLTSRIEALEAVKFDSNGKLTFHSTPEPGFPMEVVSRMVALADGRSVILGQAIPALEHDGPILTTLSASGAIGSWVSTNDLNSNTLDLDGASAALAVASDGKLLVGGNPTSQSDYMLMKFQIGSPSDARPDQFAHGETSSMVRDSSNRLHLAYFDSSTKTLKYVQRLSNGKWKTPVTVAATPGSGSYVSIGLGSKGPIIAYFDGSSADLRLAESSDGGKTWSTSLVDGNGVTGLYPSMTIATGDVIWLGYFDKTDGDLKFASRRPGRNWILSTVDSKGNVGRSALLFVDPTNDKPVIAYSDTTNKSVKCAFYRTNGAWRAEVAARTVGGSAYVSGAAFGTRIAVAYYDVQNGDAKIAERNLGEWQTGTLASKKNVGLFNSVLVRDGSPFVYYYNASTNTSLMSDPRDPRSVRIGVNNGGKYLSVFSEDGWTDLAYFDPSDGFLKVRSGPIPPSSQ